jgi:hypothetical protein
MKSDYTRPFTAVKDADGNDLFCETGLSEDAGGPFDDLTDRCVETDVVRRYSGNIRITS